ncbi:dihydrolipoamide acetyltransferase family protein [Risungbinella massiliensis]|uniref:dihydrolipoamide acetyltransferase family protein n=1 Tax=Risungbinella massiliensis TaxID=1329796 RepID=UPI0005CBAA33|nr:dihydrolipoamide acetyltransferase family protein [Risungbinella massiliensis]
MKEDVRMPQLGESVTEGTIAKWLKQPGETISLYDPICEVTTDKVNAEVPATIEGKMAELLVEEGQTVSVGELICRIEVVGSEETTAKTGTVVQPSTVVDTTKELITDTKVADTSAKKRFSPAVLRLADEHQIDLQLLTGTGRGGRITRKDVLKAVEEGVPEAKTETVATKNEPTVSAPINVPSEPEVEATTPIAPVAPSTPKPMVSPATSEPEDIEIPVTPVRRAIANRMLTSKQEIPHAWMMVEVDVTGLVELRKAKKAAFMEREGIPLTFMPFFLEATIEGLKAYPQLNSVWQGDHILQKKRINLSLAVATEDSLYVPVIHDADEKNIRGLQKSVIRLAEKARTGKLELADTQGGTFTVNNTGSFGSIASQPIINHPQAAILAFESIQKRPVFFESGMFAVRDKMNLCLSLDHRVLDGWVVGQFLKVVKDKLESYSVNHEI